MPKINLTQAAVDKLPTPPANTVFWDTGLAGFGVRVSPKGRKTFIAQYRVSGGREVVETIGTTAVLPRVADARERARHSLLKAKDGINPVEQRRQQQAAEKAAAAAGALTFGKLADRYRAEHLPKLKPRSAAELDRLLGRVARFFADKPVHLIGKGDVLDLIQPPVQPSRFSAGGRVEASNLLKATRQTLRWAVECDLIASDPTAGVRKPVTQKGERERVLDDDEIVRFWRGCDAIGYPFGPLFQLLLVTGQRLREVGQMPWSELDLTNRVWHLPGVRAKNSKAHDIHLSDAAMQIIEALPRLAPLPGKPTWVFSMTGEHPVVGYAKLKAQVAEMMGVSDWTLHDLRRTATTVMARLKVPPHVADKVLNHTSGTIRGVAAVYNRHEYRDERQDALDVLGQFVTRLVDPETTPDNVVPLRSA